MPNRGQVNDQNRQQQDQKGLQNPGAFSPEDDETEEADRTQLAQDPRGRKRRAESGQTDSQPTIEQEDQDAENEEAEDDEDEVDGIGARP